jgi:predicted nucleic acid-binding protein
MRRYLIDTPLLTAYLHRRSAAVVMISPWIGQREVATSILVYGEVVEYLKGRPDFPLHHAELRELLGEIPPYFLTYKIMERYSDIRRQLRRQGPGLIGDVDTLIAATALQRGLTVVTTDRDFERVPNLQVNVVPRPSLAVP